MYLATCFISSKSSSGQLLLHVHSALWDKKLFSTNLLQHRRFADRYIHCLLCVLTSQPRVSLHSPLRLIAV